MPIPRSTGVRALIKTLAVIGGLWILANVGYFLFPLVGYDISYNDSPIVIALYFIVWAAISIEFFREHFTYQYDYRSRIWTYGALSLVSAAIIWGSLYLFTQLPLLNGPRLEPYSDILFATPWYFLPKSAEVLMQQVLIAILILEFHSFFGSLRSTALWYAICFGGSHVALFFLSAAPTPYALFITIGSLLSALLFPYLILRVRGGFIYAYAIHLLFYIGLAMLTHALPPPGYFSA